MIYAERGNRVKQISEADIPKYLEQGYTITDAKGSVIKESVPLDVPTLRLAYQNHTDEIKALKAHIERLTAKLAECEHTQKSTSVNEALVLDIEEPKQTKSTTRRGSRAAEAE